MREEEKQYLEWSRDHPKEDALLTREIREFVSRRPVMEECGVLGPQPLVLPAVRPRRDDPNP